ncbi:hypothetical protein Pmani_025760 [Petrolisthes manimaculis]|uniref:Uncharacterized protein n=1 Tax=Petrolisthes manimaculis TaxID=1843537 RepID=A0AAE1P7I8_9EUCA|nr:hypothetical protein Pmani_025749 [Petrolisthes manimaculis]KAK4302152.1 hypothetical protein Pmani_025760 [Petrolisthes manimaculis]
MRGAVCWTDHRLVRVKLNLCIVPHHRRRPKLVRLTFSTARLLSNRYLQDFQTSLDEKIDDRGPLTGMPEDKWSQFKQVVTETDTAGTAPPGMTDTKDKEGIIARWEEHFGQLLNRPSTVDQAVLEQIPQKPTQEDLDIPPTEDELRCVDSFKYLRSTISADGSLDKEITSRIQKASQALGRLRVKVLQRKGITLSTKLKISLIYGCETWTLFRRHIKQLEQFHNRSLRMIMSIHWQDRVTNQEVLNRAESTSPCC